jgi:hypothetical protein
MAAKFRAIDTEKRPSRNAGLFGFCEAVLFRAIVAIEYVRPG